MSGLVADADRDGDGDADVHGAPAPKNAGDVKAARCVASRMKEQGMRWKDDENGILFLEVRLPAKK